MQIDINSSEAKIFSDFEKYAKFICQQYDITVQLDSVKAETDGKTIYLPNITNMTAEELEMMYGILLHESGHIKYSSFNVEDFSNIKTESRAFMTNAIEDARIENLLLKDFDGAKMILEDLYCNHLANKELMKKVFKHTGVRPDLFTSLCFYIHNELVNFKTPELKEVVGVANAKKIEAFVLKNNIDNLLQAELKTWDDVVVLTNKICDLFFKSTKDKSKPISIKQDEKKKDDAQKILDSLKRRTEAYGKSLEEENQNLLNIDEELNIFDSENFAKVSSLEDELDRLNESQNILSRDLEYKKEVIANQKQIEQYGAEIAALKTKLDSTLEKIKESQNILDSKINPAGRKLTEKQEKSYGEKVLSYKSAIEKIQSKLDSMEKLRKNLEESMPMDLENFNQEKVDEISEQISNLNEICEEKNTELNSVLKERELIENKKTEVFSKINSIEKQMSDNFSKAVMGLNDAGMADSFGIDILPATHYEDVWPSAAEVQKDFDKKASDKTGMIVKNGQKLGGFDGTNIRNIMMFVDDNLNKVKEIDVLELFKEKIGFSKLSDFNNTSSAKNTGDLSVVGVKGTFRQHIPLTTELDVVKHENKSSSITVKMMNEMICKNARFYEQLKRIFNKNFRFTKKDFWRGAQEDGNFDSRNLWKLPTKQGDDYYEICNPKYINKVAASILVDVSGSQDKDITGYGERIKEMVLGLSLALDSVHISHEVIGYNAPLSEEMRALNASSIYTRRSNFLNTIIYKEAKQKNKDSIMNMELGLADNSDGESLRIAVSRLKKIRAKSHMLFLISDGKPFLTDTDISVLDEDFKAALGFAQKNKVHVVGLGFFDNLKEFLNKSFCNIDNQENVLKFFSEMKLNGVMK